MGGGLVRKRARSRERRSLPQESEIVILGRKPRSGCEIKTEQEPINRRCAATAQTHGGASACWCRDAGGGTRVSRQPVGRAAMGWACGRTATGSRRLEQQADIGGTSSQSNRAGDRIAHPDASRAAREDERP